MYWIAGVGVVGLLLWQEYRRRHQGLGYQTRAKAGLPRVARWPHGDPMKPLPGYNRGSTGYDNTRVEEE